MMQTFCLFFNIVIIGFVNCNANEECKAPYYKIGQGCYYISTNRVSGNEAFARCLKIGGYLANLETIEEAMTLTSVLIRKNTGLSYYVGGRNINRYLSNGDWRWIKNGKMIHMRYYIFGPGEPNGSNNGPQDCVFFYAPDKYNIHNVMCYSSKYDSGYICEK